MGNARREMVSRADSEAQIANAFRKVAWPPDFSGKIGRILGAVALLALAHDGFSLGFSHVIENLIGYYNQLVVLGLGWADPIIRSLLDFFGFFELSLRSHWRHVFVLIGIYLFRNAGVSFAAGAPWTGWFRVVWGIIIAVFVSVITGIIDLGDSRFNTQFSFAAIPILGYFLYRLGYQFWAASFLRTRWAETFDGPTDRWLRFLVNGVASDAKQVGVGILLAAILLLFPPIAKMDAAGLFVLILLVFVLAIRFFLDGISVANRTQREGELWWSAYWRSGSVQLASAMFGVFFWAVGTVAVNVGLAAAGL